MVDYDITGRRCVQFGRKHHNSNKVNMVNMIFMVMIVFMVIMVNMIIMVIIVFMVTGNTTIQRRSTWST